MLSLKLRKKAIITIITIITPSTSIINGGSVGGDGGMKYVIGGGGGMKNVIGGGGGMKNVIGGGGGMKHVIGGIIIAGILCVA